MLTCIEKHNYLVNDLVYKLKKKKAYIQSPAFSMKSYQSVKEVLYKK